MSPGDTVAKYKVRPTDFVNPPDSEAALIARLLGLPPAGRAEYLRRAELPSGWGWVRLVGFGDYLNYVGIVMLASLSVLCLLAIFPLLLRRKDTAFILIVLAEIAILFVAASGLLVVGH